MNNQINKVEQKVPFTKKMLRISLAFVVFLVLLEIVLLLTNYGGNLNLFIEAPNDYKNFISTNSNIGRKYFLQDELATEIPFQLLSKTKTDSSYRIFVLSSSDLIGFPLATNASFVTYLKRGLQRAFPSKDIEIINIGMPGVNSYTFRDLIDEVIEQQPDLLLIYSGHNEYYGALGVASTQSLGSSVWFVNAFLNLERLKTFILLKDAIGWSKSIFDSRSELSLVLKESAIAKMIGEDRIPFKSQLYEDGINQFDENLTFILNKAKKANISVILGEVVSNSKNQKPFLSADSGYSANKVYSKAVKLEVDSNFADANKAYTLAKDYDLLRLRAPSDINNTINNLAKQFDYEVVNYVELFEKESPNGLMGNNLFIDYIHPNIEGQYLLAKSFYNRIIEQRILGAPLVDSFFVNKNDFITPLDSVYSFLKTQEYKGILQNKTDSNKFYSEYFIPKNLVEKIAYHIISSKDYSLNLGHLELAKSYEKENELELAYQEYNALIASQPYKTDFYEQAAIILLKQQKFVKADSLLEVSLKYSDSKFANKWVGQIAIRNEDYQKAIEFLSRADLNDTQVIFNLSRAYYITEQWGFGEKYFQKLFHMNGEGEYIRFLKRLRAETRP